MRPGSYSSESEQEEQGDFGPHASPLATTPPHGARDVPDRIGENKTPPYNDQQIEDAIRARIYKDDIKVFDLSVLVDNGFVTITGYVESHSNKCDLEDVIAAVGGVTALENRLEIHHAHLPPKTKIPAASEDVLPRKDSMQNR